MVIVIQNAYITRLKEKVITVYVDYKPQMLKSDNKG